MLDKVYINIFFYKEHVQLQLYKIRFDSIRSSAGPIGVRMITICKQLLALQTIVYFLSSHSKCYTIYIQIALAVISNVINILNKMEFPLNFNVNAHSNIRPISLLFSSFLQHFFFQKKIICHAIKRKSQFQFSKLQDEAVEGALKDIGLLQTIIAKEIIYTKIDKPKLINIHAHTPNNHIFYTHSVIQKQLLTTSHTHTYTLHVTRTHLYFQHHVWNKL